MARLAKWHSDVLDWYEYGGWLPCGVVFGLVYAYVFGGPLS